MNTASTKPPEVPGRLDDLLQLARDAGNGEVSEEKHQQDKEQLLASLAGGRKHARWPLRLAVAAVCLLALGLWWRTESQQRLWSRAEPQAMGVQLLVAGAADALVIEQAVEARASEATLAFEDGSRIVLATGSRGRLRALGAHGAAFELERGQCDVEVTPRPGADWSLSAGPYLVRVTGTAFQLVWQPEAQALTVTMQRGSVVVSGGLATSGAPLVAGQQLRVAADALRIDRIGTTSARVPADEVLAGPAASAQQVRAPIVQPPSSAAPPTGSATSVAAAGASSALARSAAPSVARRETGWSQLVARGAFEQVVNSAQARGVDGVLATAPLADLVALADAARYVGRGELAAQALRAQRQRFAGSGAARAAAFLLGRMADAAGQPAQALAHYQSYLAEGGGPLAREALGRAMLASERSGAAAQSAELARSYLRRHPSGPHASSAIRILGDATVGAEPPAAGSVDGGDGP